MRPSSWYARLREQTLCRLGWHCRPWRRILKFDGGNLPLLCCYCYLIIGHERHGQVRLLPGTRNRGGRLPAPRRKGVIRNGNDSR